MFKLKPILFVFPICVICFLISVISSYASEESLTITTYYPSPYGSYRELRSQRIAIGDDYIQGKDYCWEGESGCTDTGGKNMIPSATDLVVQGNVGIGTTDIFGGVHIKKSGQALVLQTGAVNDSFDIQFYDADDLSNAYKWDLTYRGNGDPGDGSGPNALKLYNTGGGGTSMTWRYDGNVGIGTANPQAKLDVNGGIRFSPSASVSMFGPYGVGYYDLGAKSFCAMAGYSDSDDANPGTSACDISFSGGRWYLSVSLTGDMSTTCKAVCIN